MGTQNFFLTGTQKFFVVPRWRQEEKHLSQYVNYVVKFSLRFAPFHFFSVVWEFINVNAQPLLLLLTWYEPDFRPVISRSHDELADSGKMREHLCRM